MKFKKYYQNYRQMDWTHDTAERNFSSLLNSTQKYYHRIELADGRAVYMLDEKIFEQLQEITKYLMLYENEKGE